MPFQLTLFVVAPLAITDGGLPSRDGVIRFSSEGKPRSELNLATGPNGRENPPDIAGEVARGVFEDRFSVPS